MGGHSYAAQDGSVLDRMNADRCEVCGREGNCEVHHVRKLADLHRVGRKDRPWWIQRMIALRRKRVNYLEHRVNRASVTLEKAARPGDLWLAGQSPSPASLPSAPLPSGVPGPLAPHLLPGAAPTPRHQCVPRGAHRPDWGRHEEARRGKAQGSPQEVARCTLNRGAQAALRVARALDHGIESRRAAQPIVRRLREVLSRPGALQYLRAQPRSAATAFLLWIAEQPGSES
jgi:hypothetical protein